MPTVQATLADNTRIKIPEWISDNASFLRWADSPDAPDKGKFGYYGDIVWIDHTMEQLFHSQIKHAIAVAMTNWAEQHGLGTYYPDGMLLTNHEAEFSTVPDGMFVSKRAILEGEVIRERGQRSTKLIGSPDIVVEVVSRSSIKKDLVEFRELYHEADISEYWLVDSRQDEPELVILEWTKRGYRSVTAVSGWVKSKALGGSFRLVLRGESVKVEAKQ